MAFGFIIARILQRNRFSLTFYPANLLQNFCPFLFVTVVHYRVNLLFLPRKSDALHITLKIYGLTPNLIYTQ